MPAPAPLLLSLPEDVLRAMLTHIMEPIGKLHNPLTAARALAILAQTSTQVLHLCCGSCQYVSRRAVHMRYCSPQPHESQKAVKQHMFCRC